MPFSRLMSALYAWLSFSMDVIWLGNNRLNPLSVEPYTITPELLQQLQTAMHISYEVQWQEVQRTNDISVFRDISDKAIVAYREGTCYVAWMGAIVAQIEDISQSWPSLFATEVCGSQGCCKVESGIASAYNSAYLEEFEATIETCYNRCEGGCPVVLTGHSQGATIAPVGAIILAKYNPILLTFGQHRVHRGSCGVLDNMETYLRVVSTCTSNGRAAYDLNAHVFGSLVGRHTGTMIIVGEGGASTLGYNADMWFFPVIEPCHNIIDPYTSSIDKLVAGPLDGYADGSLCTRHIECKSRNCADTRCAA